MALDDQPEISFSIPKVHCHGNQFLLLISTELIRWTQADSGAAGRVNVGLCPAYSSVQYVALLDLIICLDILPRTKNACKTAEMKMKQETALIIIVLVGLKIIIINVFV